MGVLILPSKKTLWKPPTGVQIDWGHSLATKFAGCWLMNEAGGNQLIDSVANQNGVITGTSPFWQPMGMQFNGTDGLVTCNPKSLLDITGHITIEAKVNMLTIPADTRYPAIIAKQTDYTGYSLNYWHYDGAGWNGVVGVTGHTGAWDKTPMYLPSVGAWHTYAFVYDGAYLRLYVDGVQVLPATSFATGLPTNSANVIMGRHYSSGTYGWLNANVEYIRVWARAMKPDEIAWLHSDPYCFLQPVIRRFYSIPEEPPFQPWAIIM